MAKVLIVYASRTGETQKIGELIGEGLRISGVQADVRKTNDIASEKDLEGYDGLVLGSATYHGDMLQGMKTFLFLAEKADLSGKAGGAFGSSTHSGEAPGFIFDTMDFALRMNMTTLGPFKLKEDDIEQEMRACQDYGKAVGSKLAG